MPRHSGLATLGMTQPDSATITIMQHKPIHLGQSGKIPASPEEAMLDRVPNPHPDTNYVARFTFPEFTVMCPVTGQPDFAIVVIDYVPNLSLIESKSLKLYLTASAITRHSMKIARSESANVCSVISSRAGCVSAATSIPAAACRSTYSGRRAGCRAMSGLPTLACALIGGGSNIARALPGLPACHLGVCARLRLPLGPAHRVRPLAGPMAGSGGTRWTGYGEGSMRSSAPRPTVAIPPRKERDALTRGFRSASGRSQRTCSGAVRAGPSLPPTVSWGHWLRRRRDPRARFLNFTLR